MTRAKVSVAIVVDKVPRNVCNELGVQIWSRRMGQMLLFRIACSTMKII